MFVLLLPFVFSATLNGSSSIYNFNVTNCLADEVQVGCGPETILFSCDITNKQFIDYSEFRIDGVYYNSSFVGFNAQYDYSKLNQTSTVNESIVFDRIRIVDTSSNIAVFDDSVSVLHDCLTCTDVGVADSCSIFDNTTFRHIYEPAGCIADFNETVSCNYCSQDLQQYLGDCTVNDTQSVQYSDLNYFTCCDVTGLGSDCSIEIYPYNSTTSQACQFLTTDFTCNIPSIVEFKDRMTFSCVLPDDEDYSCVVNVYEDERLVQVNPEISEYTAGLLTIKGERTEDKEFFTPNNRVLNAYFTKKNLLTNQAFMVEVQCNSASNSYVSQELVNPFYESNAWLGNRAVWVKDDMGYIIFGIILALAIVVLLLWLFRIAKGD